MYCGASTSPLDGELIVSCSSSEFGAFLEFTFADDGDFEDFAADDDDDEQY